jgi:hypothetical protein
VDPARLPDQLVLRSWTERGVRELSVDEPLTQRSPVLEFLRFLRDAAGQRMAVRWGGNLGLDVPAVSHLPPAIDHDGAWHLAYRPLSLTWRRGPGFVRVCREHGPGDQADIVFGDPLLVRAFILAQHPVRPADHPSDQGVPAALDFLVSHGLLVAHGDRVLATPVRLLRWPKLPGPAK